MSEMLRAQLYALRAQVDAMIIGVEGAAPPRKAGSCPQCGAAEEKQADASSLAQPTLKKCLVCQHEYP